MKKNIKFASIILAVIILSALSAFGIKSLLKTKNVVETANVLEVSWYDEKGTEFTITTKEQLIEFVIYISKLT